MKDIIIIPTYNERQNISELIPKIFGINKNLYILIVDDNSPDGTAEAAEKMKINYPNISVLKRPAKLGLSTAYLEAFIMIVKDPEARSIIMMDADLSHDPNEISKMLDNLNIYDLVIGSRYIKGGRTENWGIYRRLLSRFGNLYCRFITRMPISECTGGFNAIKISSLKKINFEKLADFTGYAFEMALKYYFFKAGMKIKEIPIVFKNRTRGKSKISNQIIREGILMPWILIFGK